MCKKLEINPGDTFPNKHWKVIAEIEKRGIQRYFLCECLLCGREYEVRLNDLRNKNSCFCCRSCAKLGENNPSWKGGISTETELLRRKIAVEINPLVRERDGFTCQKCGDNKGGNFNCHHIFDMQNYYNLACEPCNLITLCINCHLNDFHRIYKTYDTNTLIDLEDWLGVEYKYRHELLDLYNQFY
jgi:hypothetical protein